MRFNHVLVWFAQLRATSVSFTAYKATNDRSLRCYGIIRDGTEVKLSLVFFFNHVTKFTLPLLVRFFSQLRINPIYCRMVKANIFILIVVRSEIHETFPNLIVMFNFWIKGKSGCNIFVTRCTVFFFSPQSSMMNFVLGLLSKVLPFVVSFCEYSISGVNLLRNLKRSEIGFNKS